MSGLKAFLHPVQREETQEVIISKRFLGEDGKPVPFKIKSLTQEENDAITRRCMVTRRVKGQELEKLDNIQYSRRLVVAATVEPDFRSEELCRAYGTMDPLELPGKMLLSGEYAQLSKAIMKLSGFDSEDLGEEAKN